MRRSRSKSPDDDTKSFSRRRSRRRIQLPQIFIDATLIPNNSKLKRSRSRTANMSSVERVGLHRLFDPRILTEIEEFYRGSFPFDNPDAKIESTIIVNNKHPIDITPFRNGDFFMIENKSDINIFNRNGKFQYSIDSTTIQNPNKIYFDNKKNILFVSDYQTNEVYVLEEKRDEWSILYSIRGGEKRFKMISDIVSTVNELVVCDYYNQILQFFDIETGEFLRSTHIVNDDEDFFPNSICFNSYLKLLYVADNINKFIYELLMDGTFNRRFENGDEYRTITQSNFCSKLIEPLFDQKCDDNQFNNIYDICISNDNEFIVISDPKSNCIQIIRTDGTFVTSYGPNKRRNRYVNFKSTFNICLNSENDLLVCDMDNHCIVRINTVN